MRFPRWLAWAAWLYCVWVGRGFTLARLRNRYRQWRRAQEIERRAQEIEHELRKRFGGDSW